MNVQNVNFDPGEGKNLLTSAKDIIYWRKYIEDDAETCDRHSEDAINRQQTLFDENGISYDLGNNSEESSDSEIDVNSTVYYYKRRKLDYSLIPLYTHDSNEGFNHRFRYDGDRGRISNPECIGELADVIESLPSARGATLYRGGSGSRGTSGAHFRTGAIKIGDHLVNTEFTSFTENPYIVKRFFGNNPAGAPGKFELDNTSVVFILEDHEDARAIGPLSATPEEAESLYNPGHNFIVTDIQELTVDGHPLVQVRLSESMGDALSANTFDLRTGDRFDRGTMTKRIGEEYTERFFEHYPAPITSGDVNQKSVSSTGSAPEEAAHSHDAYTSELDGASGAQENTSDQIPNARPTKPKLIGGGAGASSVQSSVCAPVSDKVPDNQHHEQGGNSPGLTTSSNKPDDHKLQIFKQKIETAPDLLQEQLNKIAEVNSKRQRILSVGNERYQKMHNELREPLAAARALKESDAALNQFEQESKDRLLADIQFSLRHGTILKDETPDRSALLLAPHVIGALHGLRPGQGVVLRDNQDRFWRYVDENIGGTPLFSRKICVTTPPGDIIVMLPRARKLTDHSVAVRRLDVALSEESIPEPKPHTHGRFFVCVAPDVGKKEKWAEIPRGEYRQGEMQEQLFQALTAGFNMSNQNKDFRRASLLDPQTLRDSAEKAFTLGLTGANQIANQYARHQQYALYLDASDALWQALEANAETKLNSIYILDTVYRNVLDKMAEAPDQLALLLTEDRNKGYNINRKLSELAWEFHTVRSASPYPLDPEMDRFLSDYLTVLFDLRDAGFLSNKALFESLSRGNTASLLQTLKDVSCSPRLAQLQREVQAQRIDHAPPSCSTFNATLLTRKIKALAGTPLLTPEEATRRYENAKPKDPRKDPGYTQHLAAREQQIRNRGFNKEVARNKMALDDVMLELQFNADKTSIGILEYQLEKAQSALTQAVKKNKAELEQTNALTEDADEDFLKLRSSPTLYGPMHYSATYLSPILSDPEAASRDIQEHIRKKNNVRRPSLMSIPTVSALDQPQPDTHAAPLDDLEQSKNRVQGSVSLSSLPSIESLALAACPEHHLQATQNQPSKALSLSSLRSEPDLVVRSGSTPEENLRTTHQPRHALSMSSLPSAQNLADRAGSTPEEILPATHQTRHALSMSSLVSTPNLVAHTAASPNENLQATHQPHHVVSINRLPSMPSLSPPMSTQIRDGTGKNHIDSAASMRRLASENRLDDTSHARISSVSRETFLPRPGHMQTLSRMLSNSRLNRTKLANLPNMSLPEGTIALPLNATIDGSTVSIPAQVNWGDLVDQKITVRVRVGANHPILINQAKNLPLASIAPEPNFPDPNTKIARAPSLPTLIEISSTDSRGIGLTFAHRNVQQSAFFVANRAGGVIKIRMDDHSELGELTIDPHPLKIRDTRQETGLENP
ncbi:hypothetical protein [Glaciimonas sp. PAMC28666]|uniref:hypothetical protein n=1 Tax=Glaciimonas sp. PAMC28666 TaxID=2807626 RepID=UPI001964CB3C|nr:hypothetical protein [Glaciimonas sp. PAMC28666]QRX84298.1 hypothetical protein JQN73_09020 [Glaciimonas sp. PAMC28666]